MLAKPLLPILLLALAAAACSKPPTGEINDPYETANRRVHAFNKGLDANLVKPVTSIGGDDDAGGESAMSLVTNVGGNLSLPGKAVNGLLQGRPGRAAQNAGRFIVNTTLGLGGIHDPAGQEFGLTEVDTDFGETLHVWGIPEGAYVELPVIGPSTQRDAVGRVVDLFIDPVYGALPEPDVYYAFGVRAGSKAGDRARFGDTVDSILHESADSYAQTRLLYLQHRRYELGMEGEAYDPYEDPYDN
ncbi:MAG: VacJ family lipoprotein [Paracoccus denitrificans]|uniref:VacJ family lipoprotein n=1 Tax=Paracoccus denitrificans TaxID=266 RepID=A0A533I6Z7_PARDE|nr:MAG: VacJ family lipoprotein [Paracoccus denitrificans]